MDIPNELRLALDRALRGAGAELARAAADLSARYREGHGRGAARYVRDDAGAAAYAATRMPATYAALMAALGATAAAMPGSAPRSLLDVGSGTGAALWAATQTWPRLEAATLIEREPAMIALGQQLAARAAHPVVARAAWQRADLAASWSAPPHDLVTSAYVLGELDEPAQLALVDRLWALASMVLLIVEPGTPRGFAIVRAAREHLIAAGGYVVAPCPHQGLCPMTEGDWCHFAQRVTRSRTQRLAKGAELGYEDEKFSYLAVARAPGAPAAARVLRHPLIRPGRSELTLCTPEGLRRETVTRADHARWRLARDLGWGDVAPDAGAPGHDADG